MAILKVPDTDSFDLWRQKTNLLALSQGDMNLLVVPLITPITGTVTSVADSLIGVGTQFLTELNVGTKVRDLYLGTERTIVEITSNTSAKTDTAFTPALAGSLILTVDMVTALNSTYVNILLGQRRILIKAIGMS